MIGDLIDIPDGYIKVIEINLDIFNGSSFGLGFKRINSHRLGEAAFKRIECLSFGSGSDNGREANRACV